MKKNKRSKSSIINKNKLINVVKVVLGERKRKRKGTKSSLLPDGQKIQTLTANVMSEPLKNTLTGLERTLYVDAIKDLKKEVKDIQAQTDISRPQYADGTFGGRSAIEILTPSTISMKGVEGMKEFLKKHKELLLSSKKGYYTDEKIESLKADQIFKLYNTLKTVMAVNKKLEGLSGGGGGGVSV